ncbi:hypothetical protein BG004_002002 [Podila humilis]|nr:hypothetical protein BG004_002002 [Podila humilis]
MRMNLMAPSREDPRLLFIANGIRVLVYRYPTLTPTSPPKLVAALEDPRNSQDTELDTMINALRVDYLGMEEIVATVNHTGGLCVWFTMNLQRDPFLLRTSESAWGLAIHAEQRMIAVSTNAHLIDIFHFGVDSPVLRKPAKRLIPEPSTATAATSSSTLSTLSESHEVLKGHLHNIPCISFSPCGRFLASTSLDGTCRIWNLATAKVIQQSTFGDLWGWGTTFIEQDAWMNITRKEYKAIPKSHLKPGAKPGYGVRDSPTAVQAFQSVAATPGRLRRSIRSRWFAGPLANTSCDESSEESGGENDIHDEDDSSNWEDDDEGQTVSDRLPSETTSRPHALNLGPEDIDPGDENPEGISSVEIGRRGTEDTQSGHSNGAKERCSMEDDKRESERTKDEIYVTRKLHPQSAKPSNQGLEGFVSFSDNILCMENLSSSPVPKSTSQVNPMSAITPQFPPSLLVCATAQNIYLLGQHPYPKRDPDPSSQSASIASGAGPTSSNHVGQSRDTIQGDDEEPESDDDDDEFEDFDMEEDDEDVSMQSELSSEDDDDSEGQAAFFEGENEIWLFPPGNDDDDDEEVSDDGGDDDNDDNESRDRPRRPTAAIGGLNATTGKKAHSPADLHVLSVARAAVNRGDGRAFRQLEHFDRLFYLQVVPDMSLLIAASQKGCVTIFRLLRVVDDDAPSSFLSMAKLPVRDTDGVKDRTEQNCKGASMASSSSEHSKHAPGAARTTIGTMSPSPANTLTIQGSKYVLFPETYLPRSEPPLSPLAGVSIVPIHKNSPSSLANHEIMTRAQSSVPSQSSSSFILHLLYLNNVMFTYEIRIKNMKEDTVRLCDLFV